MITKEVKDQASLIEALLIRLNETMADDTTYRTNESIYVSRSLERASVKLHQMLEPHASKPEDERLERIATRLMQHYISKDWKLDHASKLSIEAAKALIYELEKE